MYVICCAEAMHALVHGCVLYWPTHASSGWQRRNDGTSDILSIICALCSFFFNDSYSLVPSPMAFGSPVDPMAFSPVPVKTIQCPLILSRLSRLTDFPNSCLSGFILDVTVLLSRHTLLSLPCDLMIKSTHFVACMFS